MTPPEPSTAEMVNSVVAAGEARLALKRAINGVLVRYARVAPLMGAPLLVVNLAMTTSLLIQWRLPHISGTLVVGGLTLVLGLLVLGMMFLWTDYLGMHVTHEDEGARFNKYATAAFLPRDAVLWHEANTPLMLAVADIMDAQGQHDRARDLRERAYRIDRWMLEGRIPRTDYPERLATRYYPRERDEEVGFRW